MGRLNVYEINNIEYCLKKLKLKFTVESTTFTHKIECVYGTFFFNSNKTIPTRELWIISLVKKHCEKLEVIDIIDTRKTIFQRSNVTKSKTLSSDLFEIDLKSAYWAVCFQKGYISPELYDKGLKVSKKARLAALGATARRVIYREFDGESYVNRQTILPGRIANVFYYAQLRVSSIMKDCVDISQWHRKEDFVFYWADAIFVRGKNSLELIETHLESIGMQFSKFKIDKIIYNKSKRSFRVESIEYFKAKGKPFRNFNFSKID